MSSICRPSDRDRPGPGAAPARIPAWAALPHHFKLPGDCTGSALSPEIRGSGYNRFDFSQLSAYPP